MNKLPSELLQENICVDLSQHAMIRLANGAKTAAFLQGQLTCNINDVTNTHSKLAAICNSKARVISFFRVIRDGDDYLLSLSNDYYQPLWDHLQKFGVFSQLRFEIDSHYSVHLGITGNEAFLDPEIIPKNVDDQWSNGEVSIIKIPGVINRYEILSTKSQHLNGILALDQLNKQTLNNWHARDIATRVPHIEQATLAMHTPHNLNLTSLDAISFDKGCYIGQEIIAKMEHLGRRKKTTRPALITAQEPPTVGSPIFDGNHKRVGEIINTATMNTDHQIILGIFPVSSDNCQFYDSNNNPLNLLYVPTSAALTKEIESHLGSKPNQ